MNKIEIAFYHRKPAKGNYSLEGFFNTLRNNLNGLTNNKIIESRFESKGILKRIYNIIEAYFKQGDINHITGDIHFVSYFLRKQKTILTILDCVVVYNASGLKRYLLKLFWYTIPEKRVEVITVISESTKKELLKIIDCDKDKIKVIPISISENFKRFEKEFNKNKPVILQVGTAKNKNLGNLIYSIKDVTCKLEIVGKISEEVKILLEQNKIDYSNSEKLSENEILRKYKECDIVSFISTYEGFGMPILEANATGRPVITSNILSMPEVAGNAACLVSPYDIEEIKNGILKIINDDKYREELVLNGYENIKKYNQKEIAMQYFNLYNIIHNKNRKAGK